MYEVDISTLAVGESVLADLFDSEGNLFLRAGQVIRTIDLTINRSRIESGIFSESSIEATQPHDVEGKQDQKPESKSGGNHTLTVEQLRIGETLRGDIVDAKGLLLLAGGSVITERFIEMLKARGVQEVTERSNEPELVVEEEEEEEEDVNASVSMPAKVQRGRSTKRSQSSSDPPAQILGRVKIDQQVLPMDELFQRIEDGHQTMAFAESELKSMTEDLLAGREVSGGSLEQFIRSLSSTISVDSDLAMLLLHYRNHAPDYLYQHCVSTSVVAMRVAAQLNHSEDDIIDIGLAALLQDIGMLRLPDSVRFAKRPLNADEMQMVEKHPDYAQSMIENITGLRSTVKMVVFQAHERTDGSGYPRRRSGMFIHPLAKILGVVDTYVALTHDRPYRKGRLPHHAMVHVLREAKQGRFDKIVIGGMLETISLYPVGSFVQLSTEKSAKVIRSNGSEFSRPIVVVVNPDGSLGKRELNLQKRSRTTITEAIAAPDLLAIAA